MARNTEKIKDIPEKVYSYSVDISTQEGVEDLFDYASETIGEIDAFIANAGLAYVEKATIPDWEHIQYIYSVNVFSPIYSLQKLVSQKTKESRIFVSTISGAGLVSLPAYSLYCSTKAALHHINGNL